MEAASNARDVQVEDNMADASSLGDIIVATSILEDFRKKYYKSCSNWKIFVKDMMEAASKLGYVKWRIL